MRQQLKHTKRSRPTAAGNSKRTAEQQAEIDAFLVRQRLLDSQITKELLRESLKLGLIVRFVDKRSPGTDWDLVRVKPRDFRWLAQLDEYGRPIKPATDGIYHGRASLASCISALDCWSTRFVDPAKEPKRKFKKRRKLKKLVVDELFKTE
jgi:hypothetical protein